MERVNYDNHNGSNSEIFNGFIEIFGRLGEVVQRVPVNGEVVNIGRAYNNDVILDDPYVSPNHLRIYIEKGRVIAEDLGSKNGFFQADGKNKERSLVVTPGIKLRIGRTCFRFCGTDFQVPEAILDHSFVSPLRFFKKPLLLALLYVFAVSILVFEFYSNIFDKNITAGLTYRLISAVVAIIIWSSIWSFANRIISHRWNFMTHCGIISALLSCFFIFNLVSTYSIFAFGLDNLLNYIIFSGYAALTSLLIYCHLRFVSIAARARLAGTSIGVAFILTALIVTMNQLSVRSFSVSPKYSITLKSPQFKLVKSTSIEQFFNLGKKFRNKIDAE